MLDTNATNAPAVIDQNYLIGAEAGGKDQFADFVEQFGRSEVNGAINNILGTTMGDLVKQIINNAPLPDFVKDAASGAIDNAVADEKQVSTPEVEAATQDELGDAIDELMEGVAKAANDMMNEEAEGGTEGGKGKAKAGGAGNWLEALAKAMGDVAGQHLGKSVGLANEIASVAGKEVSTKDEKADQANEMTALQAQMQAETQMFKLAQEATTTIIKSVGEALSSTARKQ